MKSSFCPLPGNFYDDLSSEDYHAGPGVSSSSLKILAKKSPLHFHKRVEVKQTPAMLTGSVLHTFVLEPDQVNSRYTFPEEWVNAKKATHNKKVENYTPEEARYADLATEAMKAGLQTIKGTRAGYEAIARAVHKHKSWKHLVGSEPAFERSFYWTDEKTGIFLKCRPDALNMSFTTTGKPMMTDLKSASDARDRAFQYQVIDHGYDLSAAMYCDGVEAVTGVKCEGWAWFVFEKEAPYATRVIYAGAEWLARGRALYRKALDTIVECGERGHWPGYDNGRPTVLPTPKWLEKETF